MANLEQTFTGTGSSNGVSIWGDYQLSISGNANSTVQLQISKDGTTWKTVEEWVGDGTNTDGGTGNVERIGRQIQPSHQYRFNVSAYAGGDSIVCCIADRL